MDISEKGHLSKEELDYMCKIVCENDNAFAFEDSEREWIDPAIVPLARIKMVPYTPWNNKLLKYVQKETEKIIIRRWFELEKKLVTIQNVGSIPDLDDLAE
ncbi:hypothetical protein HK096_011491 [Nowakowskiella sp. JEL0078]|nr:hypothetical protein HK096_011491 [Nowakowskiella sp. JEL0078]